MENKMTRKELLTAIINGETLTEQHLTVAKAWLVALNKKSEHKAVNKTALVNAALAVKVAAAITANPDEQINAKWITAHVDGIATPQKAVGVARQGIKDGILERYEVKGKAFYRAL